MKIQLAGAAMALMSGLLLGGAMQPHLDETATGPAGPQMLTEVGGARSETFDAGISMASYHGNLPDYVMGTDWKRSMTWPQEQAAVSTPREDVRDEGAKGEPPAVLTHAIYDEPAPARRAYPSQGGARSAADAAVEDDTLPADPDPGH